MALTTNTGNNSANALESIKEANKHVTLKATSGHPSRKEGEVFSIHANHEEKLTSAGWAIPTTDKVGEIKPTKETKVSDAKKPTASKEPNDAPAK